MILHYLYLISEKRYFSSFPMLSFFCSNKHIFSLSLYVRASQYVMKIELLEQLLRDSHNLKICLSCDSGRITITEEIKIVISHIDGFVSIGSDDSVFY